MDLELDPYCLYMVLFASQRVEEYPDLPFNYDQTYEGTSDTMATPPETDNSLDGKSDDEGGDNQYKSYAEPRRDRMVW